MTTMTKNTASQRQVDFINRLQGERVWYEFDPENRADNIVRAQDEPEAYAAGVSIAVGRRMWREGEFSKAVASQVIEALLAAPEKPKAPDCDTCGDVRRVPWMIEADPNCYQEQDSDGMVPCPDCSTHGTEGVEIGPAEEGMHQFGGVIFKVQRAVNGSGRLYAKALVEAPGSDSGWTFEYAPGAIKNLSAATKLSLAEAKAFGALYGTCCVCGRTLTNEDSIAAGIGPICAGKF